MRRLAATFTVAVVLSGVIAALGGCGGGGSTRTVTSARTVTGTAISPPADAHAGTAEHLTIGVSENNPWLIDPGPVPDGFAPWRDRVAALHPARYRLFVDWSTLQPDPTRPVELAQPNDGCLRGIAPCGAFAGMKDRLRAIAARQQADGGGWDTMIVLQGVPEWAAIPASGCEQKGADYRARPITDAGIAGYRALIRALLALGRAEGVTLRWWSPYNEPNHPGFISPQRATCDVSSPSLARRSTAGSCAPPAPS